MKKLFICALLFLGHNPLYSQNPDFPQGSVRIGINDVKPTPDPLPSKPVILKTSWRSKYIATNNLTIYAKPVVQSTAIIPVGTKGYYIQPWGSRSGANGWWQDFGDEVDIAFGRSINIKRNKYNLDYGYNFYNLFNKGDLHALYAGLSQNTGRLKPYGYVEFDFPRHRQILKGGGPTIKIGTKYTIGSIGRCQLNSDANFVGHGPAYGLPAEFVSSGQLKLSVDIPLAKNITITPEIGYQKNIGRPIARGGFAQTTTFGGLTFTILY